MIALYTNCEPHLGYARLFGEKTMPLDHYVPQVHLRKFYSPALGNRMYAIRKSDLKALMPDSQAVCRIMDGSTNAYLRKDREIEDFLKTIEPNYNAALDKLIAGEIDSKCVYTIAGFVRYPESVVLPHLVVGDGVERSPRFCGIVSRSGR